MRGAFLGPAFSEMISSNGWLAWCCFDRLVTGEMIETCADELTAAAPSDGFREEWSSARARSEDDPFWRCPLADDAATLNLKVKYRESFRPFAPAVTREAVNDWFDLDTDSPYMLLVANVRK